MELFENDKRIIGYEANRKISPAEHLLKPKNWRIETKKKLFESLEAENAFR